MKWRDGDELGPVATERYWAPGVGFAGGDGPPQGLAPQQKRDLLSALDKGLARHNEDPSRPTDDEILVAWDLMNVVFSSDLAAALGADRMEFELEGSSK